MAIGRNAARRLTGCATIIGRAAASLLLPGIPRLELRGLLFAAPVFAQAPLNLLGGAYTDRIGGRRIMFGSCVATMAAGLWLAFTHGFWMLLAGQIVLILARAAFWPATWAALAVALMRQWAFAKRL